MSGNRVRFYSDIVDNVSGKLDKMRDKFDQLGTSKGAQSILMGVGVSAGIGAMDALGASMSRLVDFAGDSIQAASNLSETVSKGRVIFGQSAEEIERWAATAADGFGQSQRQAIDAAATFATFGKSAGLAAGDLVGFSTRMTELASDLASFNNTSVDEAITALGAAMRGESEPIRRYGVLLNEATLRDEALRLGLIKTTKEALTPQQRVLAAQAAILKQTTDAQGDFERTSDGLANTQRTLTAQMEDLTAAIGQELLPVAVELANAVKDNVVPALKDMLQFVKDAEPAWEVLGLAIDTVTKGPLGAGLAEAEEQIEEFREAQIQALTDAATAWGDSTDGMTEAQRELNRGLVGVTRNTDDFRAEQRDLEAATVDLTEVLDGLKEKVDDVADALGVAVYGPAQLKGKLAELQQELREDIAQLEKLEAIKDPTREQRENIAITKGEIAATREEILNTRVELALLDGTGLDALIKDVERLARRTGAAGDEARELLRLLRAIRDTPVVHDSFRQTGQSGSGGNHRAHGGPVWPGVWTVGENGPETLLMGANGSGYVIPNQGGGGAGTSITFNVSATGSGEDLARELVVHLKRELTRQGISL